MSYSPATPTDRAEMLAAIGVNSIEDLFADVPAAVRFPKLDLPEPLSEMETMRELMNLGEANADNNQSTTSGQNDMARPDRAACRVAPYHFGTISLISLVAVPFRRHILDLTPHSPPSTISNNLIQTIHFWGRDLAGGQPPGRAPKGQTARVSGPRGETLRHKGPRKRDPLKSRAGQHLARPHRRGNGPAAAARNLSGPAQRTHALDQPCVLFICLEALRCPIPLT